MSRELDFSSLVPPITEEFTRRLLEKRTARVMVPITGELLVDVKVVHGFLDDAMLMLTRYVYGEQLAPAVTTVAARDGAPDGRWQNLKAALFPAWALRRWPVRRETLWFEIDVTTYRHYPDVPAPLNGQPHVIVQDVAAKQVRW